MSDEKAIYWLTQVSGWFGYILLILFQNLLAGQVDSGIVKVLFVNFALGITLSHAMRYLVVYTGLLSMKILKAAPGIILLSLCFGILASLVYAGISDLFFQSDKKILVSPFNLMVELFFPFFTIYLFWNILYFAAIYLKNYEREEVKNLRLTASMNEVELSNLRSQLNPHFMFNALNSIRALVDENPKLAKLSITRMSSILRSSLLAEKRRFVTLAEEIRVVTDYLELEKIRYEERLRFEIDVPGHLMGVQVPPLLIQTCAENAVKHGISKITEGGLVRISVEERDESLIIQIFNSGAYQPGTEVSTQSTGIGLNNSRRRLNLMYNEQAHLEIQGTTDGVICVICIPLTTEIKKQTHENPAH